MEGFGPSTFGELYADEYDAQHNPGTTELAVALLAELAGSGKALELAIGTGRVALPLANLGVDIHGIDGSPEMAARLREKAGGAAIPVTIGDMAELAVDQAYDFAFLVFNTLFNLTSQRQQVRCFQNVARHLTNEGAFLIEAFVPDIGQFTNGQSVRTKRLDMDSVTLEATLHDPVEQTIDYQRIEITRAGVRLKPLPMRYAWPAEIDLMAELAGLRLEQRWGGWDRSSFTAASGNHVSLYRKTPG